MLTIDMLLKLSLTSTSPLAEWTISMLLPNVSLQLCICCKSKIHGAPLRIQRAWDNAFRAEETKDTMHSILVPP